MRHRFYDPAAARFLTPDPLGAWGDPMALGNAYAFAGNNPAGNRDPMGLFGIAGALIGAVGGAVVGGTVAWWQGESILAGAGKGTVIGAVGGATMGLGLAAGTGLATMAGASTTVATTAGVLTGGTLAGAAEGAAAHLLGETGDLTLGQSVALGAGMGLVTAGLVHGGSSYVRSVGDGIAKAVGEGVEEGLERGLRGSATTAASTVAATGSSAATTASSAVATEANSAFFWSGRTNGVGGRDVAETIARERHGVTLEVLVGERGIRTPVWDPADPASIAAWDQLSLQCAEQASGVVRVVLGKNLRPGSTWETVEVPALLKNSKVTAIFEIDPCTEATNEIFRR